MRAKIRLCIVQRWHWRRAQGSNLHRRSVGRNERSLDASDHLFQPLCVGREVLRDMHAAAEVNNGDQAVGTGVCVNELRSGLPCSYLIAHIHGRVIEEQHHVAFLVFRRRGGILLERKGRDGLFLVIFPDLELLGGEVADVVAFLVGDHTVHQHQSRLYADYSGAGVGGGLLWRLRRGNGNRLLPAQPPARHAYYRDEENQPSNLHNSTSTALRNLDRTIFSGHQLSLSVPHDQAHQVTAPLYIKTGLQSDAGAQFALQGVIFQAHLQDFFAPLYIIPIPIEEGRNHGQIISVSPFHFSKVQAPHVNMSQDSELGIGITRLEELGTQFDWEIVHFLLGKNRILDLLLGLLRCVRRVGGSIIPPPRLQGKLLRAFQCNFQTVKAAVQLQVLGGKGKHVIIFRRGADSPEALVHVVIIVEESSARPICQHGQNIGIRRSARDLVLKLVSHYEGA